MAHGLQFSFQRYEKKYLLTPAQYEFLRARLGRYMKEDEYGQYSISNLYYDTPDFYLIRRSLERPVYKEKLRMRSYGTPGADAPVFVELKKKFDGVVYKRRAVMDAAHAADYLAGVCPPPQPGQITREIDWFMGRFQPIPQVFIGYRREALADRESGQLRVTFDTDLRWRDTELDLRCGDYGQAILPPDQILMEVKIPGVAPVWLARLLSEAGAFSTTFSKYGTCYRNNLAGRREKIQKKEVLCCA